MVSDEFVGLAALAGLAVAAGRSRADDGTNGSNGDDGDNGGDTQPKQPADMDHQLSISSLEPSPSTVRLVVSDEIAVSDERQFTDVGKNFVDFQPQSDPLTVGYDGSIELLNWPDGALKTVRDGERVDPFELSDFGPRIRNTDTQGSTVVELCFYQTRQLYLRNGYAPARAAAEYVAGALNSHDIGYDLLWGLPVIDSPTQAVTCDEGYLDGGDGFPPAYSWWREHLQGRSDLLSQDVEANTGQSATISGDVSTQRKDCNMLLTDSRGGGCTLVSGAWGVSGCSDVDRVPGYSNGPWEDELHSQLWVCMHELGHAFGYTHPGGCNRFAGGEAWKSDVGSVTYWNRTACVAGFDCENACGTYTPAKEGFDATRQWTEWTDCSVQQVFSRQWGSEQGNVQVRGDDYLSGTITGDEDKSACDLCAPTSSLERGCGHTGCDCC